MKQSTSYIIEQPTTLISNTLPYDSKVVIAVLNWGLGHASRCIPIIKLLIKNNNKVIIASDGDAESYLMQTFPSLTFYTLPSYDIQYKYSSPIINIISQFFKGLRVRKAEQNALLQLVNENLDIRLIISDNRFGCFHHNVKSVFITHQLKPFHTLTIMRYAFSIFMKMIIHPFTEIWVPDHGPSTKRLSGRLSDDTGIVQQVKYIGTLSRFSKNKVHIPSHQDKILILLSGPEPQRSILEKKLITILGTRKDKEIILVRGKIDGAMISNHPHIKVYNFLSGAKLEQAILQAQTIICRSGYSTIMDLFELEKSAILIPTPGQTEQEYLAHHLHKLYGWKVVDQNKLEKLDI